MPLRPPAGYIRPGYNPLQVANAPTVGTASAGDTTASVAFTAPSNVGGGAISLYYAVSSPGQFTGTSVTSPVTVTGLTNGTSYTFTVWAANPFGPSPYSASSNSVTPSSPYIEEVFSTWLYTGNGSTQTITNGVDLSTYGGMVWFKSRGNTAQHAVVDSNRGTRYTLAPPLTDGQVDQFGNTISLLSTGFTINAGYTEQNANNYNYVSWTFRKQPKFFDVVTWTGDGNASKTISHSLGSVPGCIITKSSSTVNNWFTYHRSLGNTQGIALNLTNAAGTNSGYWNNTSPTSTNFTVGSFENASGQTYVAYLFAHDAGGFGPTGTDNVITCGGGTFDGSGYAVVNLGYEPQWVLIKSTTYADNWYLADTMRGATAFLTSGTNSTNFLYPNLSSPETSTSYGVVPNATGFTFLNGSSGQGYIYIAIRRGPMKTPTSGTSVFAPTVTAANLGVKITTGFVTDLQMANYTAGDSNNTDFADRLRGIANTNVGSPTLASSSTRAENTSVNYLYAADNTGWLQGGYSANATSLRYDFSRAPGFFDVVCYTGDGVNGKALNHNLGVAPELAFFKERSAVSSLGWPAVFGFSSTAVSFQGLLNNTGATYQSTNVSYASSSFIKAQPTASTITVGNYTDINASGQTYVAYLFASCPGVSKVGSYTGTGALQTINCGFTGGARFVLIKRTDSTGDWWVYDSARGITSGNDPYLLMNSTAAEVTGTNYVDTTSVGFQVTAAAPAGLNANGGTYIFLAIA